MGFFSIFKKVKEPRENENTGGIVDNSFKAPKEIKSKNIESFKAYFSLWDQFYDGDLRCFSFKIEKNSSGEYILSEDGRINISVPIERPLLLELQKIADDYSLSLKNGLDKYTSGLSEEFAPCMFSATYDSGEKLYFSENNDPEAKWAQAVKELFFKEFIRQGHKELLTK